MGFGGFAFEIRRRDDELFASHVVERGHIDHGVARAINLAIRDRHHATGGAAMKIRRLGAYEVGSESICGNAGKPTLTPGPFLRYYES